MFGFACFLYFDDGSFRPTKPLERGGNCITRARPSRARFADFPSRAARWCVCTPFVIRSWRGSPRWKATNWKGYRWLHSFRPARGTIARRTWHPWYTTFGGYVQSVAAVLLPGMTSCWTPAGSRRRIGPTPSNMNDRLATGTIPGREPASSVIHTTN